MMNIVLACNAGMSTSMMKMRLGQETKARGIEASVAAVLVSELDEYVDTASVILLGPQVWYAEKELKEKYPNVPMMVMDMRDYGSINAKVVLDKALQLLK